MSTGGGNKNAVQSEINVTPLIDVLLVLLIIFLVVMPIMMKMETLEVPRKLTDMEMPDPNSIQLTVSVKDDGTFYFNDGSKDQPDPIQLADIAPTLRKKLESMHAGTEKVVFVDFEGKVPWNTVVGTMDTIRGLAADVNHDEIKVALKVKDDQAPPK
jgi:biopolymer transport protein ExbD